MNKKIIFLSGLLLTSATVNAEECHCVDDDYGNYGCYTISGSACGPSAKRGKSSPGFFSSMFDKIFDDKDRPVKYFNMKIPSCSGNQLQRAVCRQDITEGKYIKDCEKYRACSMMYPNNLKRHK
jgi:hypothetical protein